MSLIANQSRDALVEYAPEMVGELRKFALDCEAERRADPETYLKCPRCYGWHSIHGNFDNLCDGCQRTILEHFPNHASVPFIREANLKWFNQSK